MTKPDTGGRGEGRRAHTPGPWDFEADEASSGKMFTVYDQHGIRLTDPYVGEREARLIAAAPDMLAALKAHQLWEKREKEGPLYPFGMKRDDPGGEQIWRAWWDDQMRLCALSHELTDAAIRAALQAQGDER